MSIELILPDGTKAEHPQGVTGRQVAESIGARLAAAAVAVTIDGVAVDLDRPLPAPGGEFSVVTAETDLGRSVLRHSAAHVLAQAVLALHPGAAFAIGPPIEDGFYYDFDIGRPFTPEDLERIEAKMTEIIAADQPFVREAMSRDKALAIFADQPFKTEIIKSVDPGEVGAGDEVTVYRNNGFVDLCRGPHVTSTGRLRAVKLLRTSGAYWRGDEKNPQLQRIYGTAWEDRKALDAYLQRLEEAEKRDHRKLGPDLDLFSFPHELGSGLAVWHPKGGMLRKLLEDHSRKLHEAYGFDFVFTPHLARAELWQISGHLEWYAEGMFPPMELDADHEYRVKPMNCPFHILVYKSRARSYRDLPMRLSELGGVYRYERSGTIHGLLRARGFTQDDSHTFTTREQLPAELDLHLKFVLQWLRDFGFTEYKAELSTRDPDKAMGGTAVWEEATEYLRQTLEAAGIDYSINEGDAAFYGPKIDIHVRDAIGRSWQVSTIQLDYLLPERFELEYISAENTAVRPVMIHCAKAGSLERFLGVVVEHYAGAFPMWLAPIQVSVIPVADRHIDYGGLVAERLRAVGLRIELDKSSETVGEKIRQALTAKHPAVLVVGDNDVENSTVGVRYYGADQERRGVALDEAVSELAKVAEGPE
ncbi:MAG TPA: threonine--tRNA ligase [Acidimicrobiia bacterium]|nr:threonine--tRNA ligase [Acidimicrobiia bacterium]